MATARFRAVCIAILATLGASAAAHAAAEVVLYRLSAGRYIRFLVADVVGDLPVTGVPQGVPGYVKADAALFCWDGDSWEGCNAGGSGGAPTGAEYLVGAAHGSLSAERVCTDSTEIDCVLTTPGQVSWALNAGSVAVSRLKTSDTPVDGQCLVYESTGDEVAFEDCGGAASDHGTLSGLSDDDHPQYQLLAGRSGGQVSVGGADVADNLELRANAAGALPRVIVDGSATVPQVSAQADTDTALALTVNGVEFTFKDDGSEGVRYVTSDGVNASLVAAVDEVGRMSGVRLCANAGGPSAAPCISEDGSGRLFHDTDGDGVKDSGEEYIDQVGGGGSRLPSMDWPPATAPDWSCEFNSSLCSGTLGASGTTSTPVSGTIDLLASVSGDPIYSLSFLPGQLCIQSDESSAQPTMLSWSLAPATNATTLAKFMVPNRNLENGEGYVGFGWSNSGDANELAENFYFNLGSGWLVRPRLENNGSAVVTDGTAAAENQHRPIAIWLVQWKEGDVYHAGWASTHDGPPQYFVSQTKTVVTDFDTFNVKFSTANNTPSIVACVDYVRQWNSLKFDFVNE